MTIKEIFTKCLCTENDCYCNCIGVEGVIKIVILNRDQLEKYRVEIEKKLSELSNFKITIKNYQWDKQLELLLLLGVGLGIVETPIYQKEKVRFSVAG